MLNRRSFLLTSAAVIAAPALPAIAEASITVGVDMATTPSTTTMWIIGTPGEFDWRPIVAETAEAAFEQYKAEWDFDYITDDGSEAWRYVKRVSHWDGRHPEDITSGDWIQIGFGACCDRCSYEQTDGSAYVVDGLCVCEECVTLSERAAMGDEAIERVVEDIGNDIATNGEDETRKLLMARGQWDALPPEIWASAVAFSKEDA